MSKVYYFAYGLNLARAEMESKAPGHKVYGLAYLENHRLAFEAVHPEKQAPATASLRPWAGSRVYGLVYELRPADLDSLDAAEGLGPYSGQALYERIRLPVYITGIQQAVPVWLYRARYTQAEAVPTLAYVYKIYSAARIIPGYPPRQLQQLEDWLVRLRPGGASR